MRLTSKGQVTIPMPIREQLGLLPWSEVEFEVDGDSVRIRKKGGTSSPAKVFGDHDTVRSRANLKRRQWLARAVYVSRVAV